MSVPLASTHGQHGSPHSPIVTVLRGIFPVARNMEGEEQKVCLPSPRCLTSVGRATTCTDSSRYCIHPLVCCCETCTPRGSGWGCPPEGGRRWSMTQSATARLSSLILSSLRKSPGSIVLELRVYGSGTLELWDVVCV